MRTSTYLLSRVLRSILFWSAQNGIRALCLTLAIASSHLLMAQVNLELECPQDIEISCEDDLDPVNTGEISFNDSCLGGELEAEVSYSDETVSADGCTEIIERTFTVSACGVTDECTQTITIIDDVGPVFPEVEDITVACIDDVPDQEELEATDECSVQMLPGPFFQSEIGNPVDSCVLTIAEGLGPDWSLWLPTLSEEGLTSGVNYDWVDEGTLVTYADGSARITGTVVNMNNPDEGFEVDMWFQNGMNWDEWSALGRSYKDDAGLAGDNYLDWTYYELVDGISTLTGTGDLAGSSLNLYHAPDSYYFGFQCGLAANNKNANEGMSGWFTYTGTVNGESIEGAGDINVDKECFTPNDLQDCVHDNEFVYVWISEDGCGNVTMQEQHIYVNDSIAPEFTVVPEDVTVECDEELPTVFEGVEAVDNCTGDVNIVYSGETVNGEGCEYTVTRTWIATDECGNSAIYEQTITVVDTTAPEFTFVPEDANYQCSDDFELEMATAVDNCSENVSVTVEESVEGDACYSEITRVFTADDGCGNISTATQVIVIEDTEGPVFEEFEVSITAECGETDDLILTATDNCSEEVDVTYEETLQSGGCVGVIVRNYTAVDGCGNETTATQYITLVDSEAPEFEGVPENMTVECDDLPEVPEVSAIDNCEGEVEVEWSEEIIEGDCPENYTIVWTWTATDLCENSASVSTEITVQDTTDPEFVDFPEDMTVECDEELGEPVFPSATDNCDEEVEIELTEVEEPGDCPNSYTILRTFRGFDNCGNEVMQVQTINVVDTTAPEFTSVPEDVTIECDEEVSSMMAEATDNCGEVTVTSSDEVAQDEECPQASVITRTFTAEDECGNVSTATQVISIVDTTAPVVEGTIEIDMPCDMVDESVMIEATDNCGDVSITFEDTPVSGGCAGKIIRDYVVADECGNTTEFQQIITLVDDVAPTFDSFPEDVTVECGEVPSNEGLDVAFSDNCTDVTLEYNGEEIIDGDCPQSYTIERTWTITDNCDNSTTATWTITVEDTTAPVFEVVPQDVTIECDQDLPTDEATAFDNCGEVTITSSDEVADGECPQEYVVTRTFTATDECGNASTAVQTITVVDTTAPEFTSVPEDVTIECDAEVPSSMAEATDNCGAVTVTSSDEVSADSVCPQASTITRTFTAEDECGNVSTAVQVITIVDTTAPVIEGEIEVDMPCDMVDESILVEASDNCGEVTLTYEDTPVSGGCAGRIIRDYTAVDECGNSSTFEQIITLVDEVAPEFVLFPEDVTVECDQVPSNEGLEVDYTDNCTDVTLEYNGEVITEGECAGQYTIERTWTITDNCENSTSATWTINVEDTTAPVFEVVPQDVTIECDQDLPTDEATAFDNCGEVTITSSDEVADGECPQEYVVTRTFTATDDCGNASTAVQVITVVDTTAPEFTSVPEDVTIECDEEVPSMMAEATDNCGAITVTSSDESVAGECPQESVITRTFTATDECGNASTATQVITIVDTTAPVVEGEFELTMPCDDVEEGIFITATDNCGDVSITYEDTNVSGGCVGHIIRDYVVTDECGNTSEFQQSILLTDEEAPEFTLFPEDVTVECDQVPSNEGLEVEYTDNCTDVTLEYNGEVITEGECAGQYTIERTWTITDNCENSTSATWTINVEDTTAPVFEVVPQDVTIECDQDLPTDEASAFDNCGEVTITSEDVITDGECPQEYVVTRTFTATDDCGNASTAVQVITVVDTTAPEFTSVPEDVTIECDEEVPSMMAEATDNCGAVTVTSSDESVAGECPQESVITRTFTATDECGNASTATQVITIVDTTAPVFDEYDAELEMACDDVMETSLTATDNCGEVEITMIEDFDAETGCIGTITRTFTAVDECGNASTAVQVITLIDEVAPVFESFPEDVTVECDQVPSNEGLNVVFSDNCSEVVLEYNGEEIIEGDCANNYTIERTWTITDSCGNSTVAIWTINVEDTTAPVFEFVPSDVTYSCDEEIEYSEAAAFDNCSEVSIETAVDTVAGDCPSNFQIVRTFTATDDCGNTSIDTQTITVVDETAPVFTSVPQGNEISCEEELPTEMAMATDNCGEVTVTFNDSIVEGDCPNNYQVVRMWTATDECGNTSSAETNYYIYDFTAPVFDGEVEDVVVQCADDVPAIADITATDNCGTATVTSSTEVLDEDECGNSVSVVTLTAADECGNTTEISYTVTVEDTTAPELIGAPEDLVLDCEDEVPSAPEVTAVDNCDDNVEVTYTEEFVGEAPAEGSVDDCRTYNPQGVSPAWSLWLQDFENGLDYYELPEGQTGNWVTYPDGSAHLTGTVYSTTQPNRGFEIDVWFENGMDWDSWSSQPFPTSYKDDNGFAEDDMLYEDWTYYIMNSDSATLTGVGDYAGSFLNLSHAPSNLYFGFQEGQAADNRTPDYGIGGWFYYDGFLNGPSFEGEVEGAGDFAFGLDCCPEYEIVRTWTAEDCSGNVTTVSQTISFEDLEEDDPAQDPQLGDSVYEAEKGEIHIGGLAPNPSRNMTYVEYTTKSSQRVVIEVFDLTGHRLDQQSQGLSKAGETYSKQINTSDLESGIYLVKVRSDKGAQTIRLVVSK